MEKIEDWILSYISEAMSQTLMVWRRMPRDVLDKQMELLFRCIPSGKIRIS
jgi:hypothetical protein